ncbi:MAG TPA: MFS transporter [Anaerolineae bacterium]|nr:MFS transporter [Anaerolineae bacterium]
MSRNRIIIVTIGIMLSLFLASMEATVVATAMPTIVGQLGGLDNYSWVFAAYMLASTTTVPLYGKLSDLYGRRKIYIIAMGLFLAGSVWCGIANSMTELIIARGLQGIGAGGIMPIAFILIGEMFTLEQRSRMQGFFSGVWGFSSIIGPLLGGYIVEQLSWHWVFLINIFPGVIAAGLVVFGWREQAQGQERRAIDYAGAVLLSAAVVALLLGLEFESSSGLILIAISIILFIALLWVEMRASDPVVPIHLFKDRLFFATIFHGMLTGWALYGFISFTPLFVQSVLGTNAMQAGITITPLLLGWVAASIIGTRLLLRVGYLKLAWLGTSLVVIASFCMSTVSANTGQTWMMIFLALLGIGMGLCIPPFLIAVQTTVERKHLGTATSFMQFSRSIGGTLGVSVMGAALGARLASNLSASGLDPNLVTQLLEPSSTSQLVIDEGARLAVANSINLVFTIGFIAAALSLLAVFVAPRIKLEDRPQPSPVSAD